jgi:hypothetical protein
MTISGAWGWRSWRLGIGGGSARGARCSEAHGFAGVKVRFELRGQIADVTQRIDQLDGESS